MPEPSTNPPTIDLLITKRCFSNIYTKGQKNYKKKSSNT